MSTIPPSRNLHEILSSLPLYRALLLTGSNLNHKLTLHSEMCRRCARFIELYNGELKDKYNHGLKPLYPACPEGIKIIRMHLGIYFAKNCYSRGRHERPELDAA